MVKYMEHDLNVIDIDTFTLKAIIKRYKDEEDMSFQQIADKLKEEYNIIRSRQAICGMYNRTINNVKIADNIYEVVDICNLSAIGYNRTEVHEIISDVYTDSLMTYGKVRDIINSSGDRIESVRKQLVTKVMTCIIAGMSMEDTIEAVSYNGNTPTDGCMDKLVQKAYTMMISDNVINQLSDMLNLTGNKEIVKNTILDLKEALDYSSIRSRLDK